MEHEILGYGPAARDRDFPKAQKENLISQPDIQRRGMARINQTSI
jgi:hypothetical protein